jgi:hypothetical protein
MAFTMGCPNFKKGLKMAFGPLGVNQVVVFLDIHNTYTRIMEIKFVVSFYYDLCGKFKIVEIVGT